MMTPEGRVKAEIKAYLKDIGAYQFWPVQTGMGAATVDCLACIKGRFWAIEVKRPGGRATPRQVITLQNVRDAHGTAVVVTSVEELKSWHPTVLLRDDDL